MIQGEDKDESPKKSDIDDKIKRQGHQDSYWAGRCGSV